jgi:hypothetical protein
MSEHLVQTDGVNPLVIQILFSCEHSGNTNSGLHQSVWQLSRSSLFSCALNVSLVCLYCMGGAYDSVLFIQVC